MSSVSDVPAQRAVMDRMTKEVGISRRHGREVRDVVARRNLLRIGRAHRDLKCIWRARTIGSPAFKSSFFLTLGPPKLSGRSSEQSTKMTG
jgi:hypothetical protein